MLNTLDLNTLPPSYKAVLTVSGNLLITCTSYEVLSFKAGLQTMGLQCEVILIDSCKFELRHVSPWQVDND